MICFTCDDCGDTLYSEEAFHQDPLASSNVQEKHAAVLTGANWLCVDRCYDERGVAWMRDLCLKCVKRRVDAASSTDATELTVADLEVLLAIKKAGLERIFNAGATARLTITFVRSMSVEDLHENMEKLEGQLKLLSPGPEQDNFSGPIAKEAEEIKPKIVTIATELYDRTEEKRYRDIANAYGNTNGE